MTLLSSKPCQTEYVNTLIVGNILALITKIIAKKSLKTTFTLTILRDFNYIYLKDTNFIYGPGVTRISDLK